LLFALLKAQYLYLKSVWYVLENETNKFCVSFFCSMVLKQDLSTIAKLLVFKLVLVPIHNYVHESWVMVEKAVISVLWKVLQCDTLWQSMQLWNLQNLECQTTFLNRETQLWWFDLLVSILMWSHQRLLKTMRCFKKQDLLGLLLLSLPKKKS